MPLIEKWLKKSKFHLNFYEKWTRKPCGFKTKSLDRFFMEHFLLHFSSNVSFFHAPWLGLIYVVNFLPQYLQGYGVSPLWVLSCSLTWVL